MPANDNFASASVISGASGNTTGTNTGATTETGEPGHNNYNPGPIYPVTLAAIGPFSTVWFKWTAPTSDYYQFSTRDLTGSMATNFKSTVQVFTGSAVNALTAVTYVLDQRVGDGYGADNGASVVFLATSGTTYYIQIDGRGAGVTGNFKLAWAKATYPVVTLGGCNGAQPSFNVAITCLATLQIADLTTDNYSSFGSFAVAAGKFAVRYAGGIAPASNCPPNFNCDLIVDGTFGPTFSRWEDLNQNTTGFSSGTYVAGCLFNDNGAAAVAVQNVPAFAPVVNDDEFSYGSFPGPYWIFQSASAPVPSGTFQGGAYGYQPSSNYNPGDYFGFGPSTGPYVICNATCPPHSPGYDGGVYWNVLPTFPLPGATFCAQTIIPHHVGGPIGIINFASAGPNTSQNPRYQLIYYPFTISMLSAYDFSLTGSGTSWNVVFLVKNNTAIDWDDCSVALLNTGGITGASGPNTVDFAPSINSSTGAFSFTASPGLVTATIQISRNGVVVGTLAFPLYPIISAAYTGIARFERNCTPKVWESEFSVSPVWPPGGFGEWPLAWGASSISCSYNIPAGTPPLSNDDAPNNCLAVSAITFSYTGFLTKIHPNIQGGASAQSVGTQCTFAWGSISLPAFNQTITIPPA